MRYDLRFVTAFLVAVLAVGSGRAAAAGCEAGSPASSSGTMPRASAASPADPEAGEYGQALETGNIPAAGPAMGKSGEEVPVIEAGGLKYRLGIDTP